MLFEKSLYVPRQSDVTTRSVTRDGFVQMTMLHVLVVATAFGSATGQMCLPTQDASELLKQRGLSIWMERWD